MSSPTTPVRPSRVRTLTEKAMANYESECGNFQNKLEKSWHAVQQELIHVNTCADEMTELQKAMQSLRQKYSDYRSLGLTFTTFLVRIGTEESLCEKTTFENIQQTYDTEVQCSLTQGQSRILNLLEITSQVSRRSKKTVYTIDSQTGLIVKKRAEAYAARTRATYAEKEAELELKKLTVEAEAQKVAAQVDSQLKLLHQQKEAASAEAEVQALLVETSEHDIQSVTELKLPYDKSARTRDYVNNISVDIQKLSDNVTIDYVGDVYDNRNVNDYDHDVNVNDDVVNHMYVNDCDHDVNDDAVNHMYVNDYDHDVNVNDDVANHIYANHGNENNANAHDNGVSTQNNCGPDMLANSRPLNWCADPYIDTQCVANPRAARSNARYVANSRTARSNAPPYHNAPNDSLLGVSDLTRHLLRKDVVTTRLTRFDDKPESYKAWKFTFDDCLKNLNVTPSEELDLLVKWLGPESSKHAISLRNANVCNPASGLIKVWERLDKRYGCPENIESAIREKLNNFPKITNRDNRKLWDLADLLAELESAKSDPSLVGLAVFDSACGVNEIVSKLPFNIQEKWTHRAARYKRDFKVTYPPFRIFSDFIREIADIRNDPSFNYNPLTMTKNDKESPKPNYRGKSQVFVQKTGISQDQAQDNVETDPDKFCPLHKTSHALNHCKGFRAKPKKERKDFLREHRICFRCCASSSHIASSCKANVMCSICKSDKHPTALHVNQDSAPSVDGGEKYSNTGGETSPKVTSVCTEICGDQFQGKSCSKICLVNIYHKDDPEKIFQTYAILDDQSNRSLISTEFCNILNMDTEASPYTLHTCAGHIDTSGRRIKGLVIEPVDKTTKIQLPQLIECSYLPDNRHEIPTPEVANQHKHLCDIADQIPSFNNKANIQLLIGRDVPQVHHVLDQRVGSPESPFAQKLTLGWVIIGEVCMNHLHQPDTVNSYKTNINILQCGRPSIFRPCQNYVKVSENSNLETSLFLRTKDDNKPGLSVEDRKFLNIMDEHFVKDEQNNWIAPLPFRPSRERLPNNKQQAINRAKSLDRSLKRDPIKREHFVAFMKRIFDSNHAEIAPPLKENEECWYLPLFGVYHPKKPDQIRGVFDASAKHEGTSLNDVLLTGPDLTNSLLGVLLRFRREPVAITADIQQMFYCFQVQEEHRNYLRFLWYRDNDPDKDIIEYRMRVHVFGNSPSPAVATYGLRRIAKEEENAYGSDVKEFIDSDFYVDDGLTSLPTSQQAVDLLRRTQQALSHGGNLRLHKIASNCVEVMKSFPSDDYHKDLKDLDLGVDKAPIQRSLGLSWDISSDMFTYQVSTDEKPYTRRGVLSTVNSLYDPLGFIAPVTIRGKALLRNLTSDTSDWDEPLPLDQQSAYDEWKDSLKYLENLQIPRTYYHRSLSQTLHKELHIFSDASEMAIASVAYLKIIDNDGNSHVGFVLGKAKLAPTHGHTIPRLELCAAVLATELYNIISDQLDVEIENVKFYTDSKVVLGYIHNETRRFYTYVCNRVDRIRKHTTPEQWNYVHTDQNPADHGTRSTSTTQLQKTNWLTGPTFLHQDSTSNRQVYDLVDPDGDKEVRLHVSTLQTTVMPRSNLGTQRFNRFSSWRTLTRTISQLRHIVRNFSGSLHDDNSECRGWHLCSDYRNPSEHREAEIFIIKQIQLEKYEIEINHINANKPLEKGSPIVGLDPYVDEDGLLRVGGRLNNADLPKGLQNPVIIPPRCHIATLLIRHYHERVRHQGRHFTEGAIRNAGFWIVSAKRSIASAIHQCVTCRKLRGKLEEQKMSDLPADRLTVAPPFTYVGVDTFGPWQVVARRTRGGQANSKRWALLFTCLTTRAVHIEVVEEMSSSCFINALRRFVSIRGPVKQFRSDRGTNFVGATDDLMIDTVNVEDDNVRHFLYDQDCTWIFNPPHSSHMGGVWERMIGIARRILDSLMSEMKTKSMTHEVLTTFMAEVSAIINARPIVPIMTDPASPFLLTPSVLLTQKGIHSVQLGDMDMKSLFKAQWMQVQTLANMFWSRWRSEYLHTLQARRKWEHKTPNIVNGDIVLLKDKTVHRNDWPVGIVTNAISSKDGLIRKAEVRTSKDGKQSMLTRPITEMVLLLKKE